MRRRSFLKQTGAAIAASSLCAPAAAQQPEVRWRLASSFPKSLDTLFGAADLIAKQVAAITQNKFQIRPFAAGEIVPGLQVLDAVQNATVECGHTAPYYYIGKDFSFAFGTALPFGLTARQQNAWMYYGGGIDALTELFKSYNCVSLPAGNTGAQMGGWFRREIKSVADLSGLKFRIAGLGGQVLAKLGVVPQQIAGGDIYPALEKGTIDATEFVGPYDDEKLGFYKVAKYYYYPGFWEGSAQVSLIVNTKKWEELPKEYQAVLQSVCAESNVHMMSEYDAKNAEAIKKLVAAGAQLRAFPHEVMAAAHKAAFELYDEVAAKNARFKKIYDGWRKFRDEQYLWFRVAESAFENFVYSAGAARGADKE
jgi:TRAP-type mannitol/chloroaromatic compound transport system substrate-binding protein